MNVTVEDILILIHSDRTGNTPFVWIYDDFDGFYPDETGKKETDLISVFLSDFVPRYSLSKRLRKNIVQKIFWTPQGIVLAVSDPPEVSG